MSATRIASRYAKSLIELAAEQDKLEVIKGDVESFSQAAKQRDFYLLIKSPIVKPSKKLAIFKELFSGKYDKLTLSFLNILIQKGREGNLPEIAEEFLSQYKKIKSISTVKVITATKLSKSALKKIRKKMEEAVVTESNIELETEINPDLIGGFILEVGDQIYDASVQHKLNELHKELER